MYTVRVHSCDICLHGYSIMWINMHLKNMLKPLYAIRTTETDNGAEKDCKLKGRKKYMKKRKIRVHLTPCYVVTPELLPGFLLTMVLVQYS